MAHTWKECIYSKLSKIKTPFVFAHKKSPPFLGGFSFRPINYNWTSQLLSTNIKLGLPKASSTASITPWKAGQ